MPTPSPLLPSTGLATVSLVLGGKSLDSSIYQVSAITITKGINHISEACIELVDGDPATDSDDFQPGQPIEVLVGYNNSNQSIFMGCVVSLALVSRGGTGSVLTVQCQDEAVKMNGNRATKPIAPQTTSIELVYGTNVEGFSLRIDAGTQPPAVTAQALAIRQQVDPIPTAVEVGLPTLQTLAGADPTKPKLALLHGTVDTAGTSTAVPGTMASLAGFARRFNGLAFISGIRHTIAAGTWITQLSLGSDEQGVAGRHPAVGEAVGTNGVAVGMHGLYSAVVKALQPDPDGGFRVLVTVAGLAGTEQWVRPTQPYASAGVGLCFYPEIGDEVVLGFLGDDVRCPVILGALYSKERAPAYPPDEKNSKKAIVTSSRLTLEFDDDKKVITLITPGNNQLVISDEAKGLTLTDQQQNSITLSDQGMALVSKSGLSISAGQDISITSTGGSVNIQAGQQVALKGLNVSVTADADLSLSGTATAALKGGTETTIRGAVVMIN